MSFINDCYRNRQTIYDCPLETPFFNGLFLELLTIIKVAGLPQNGQSSSFGSGVSDSRPVPFELPFDVLGGSPTIAVAKESFLGRLGYVFFSLSLLLFGFEPSSLFRRAFLPNTGSFAASAAASTNSTLMLERRDLASLPHPRNLICPLVLQV